MFKYKQNRSLFKSYNEGILDTRDQIYFSTMYYNKLPCAYISEIYIRKYRRNNVPINRIDIAGRSFIKDEMINDIYRMLIFYPQNKSGVKILTLNIDYSSKFHSSIFVLYVKREDRYKIKDLESILRDSYVNNSIVNIVIQIKKDESGRV